MTKSLPMALADQFSEVTVQPASFLGSASVRTGLRVQAEAYVARALVMVSRARIIVEGDRSKAIPLLKAKRVAFGAHMQRYQRFKHTEIFDPAVKYAPESSRIVARSMKVDCILLGETIGSYNSRWLGVADRDWPAYQKDMLVTTQMIKASLEAEMRAIDQLLVIADIYGD